MVGSYTRRSLLGAATAVGVGGLGGCLGAGKSETTPTGGGRTPIPTTGGQERRTETRVAGSVPIEGVPGVLPRERPEWLFDPDSVWYERLSTAPPIHPKNEAMLRSIDLLLDHGDGWAVSVRKWAVSAYVADESTPRADVPMVDRWARDMDLVLRDVPIPEGAVPDPSGDGALAILDPTTGFEYDFWRARRKNDWWVAPWGNKIPLSGSGIYPCGLGARASGAAYLAGLIWPGELAAGRIDHKLAFSFRYNHSGGPVAPLTDTDGRFTPESMRREYRSRTGRQAEVEPLAEGSILQLDPALDLEAFEVDDPWTGERRPLEPYERTLARAMQEYGIIDVDNGGSFSFETIHPQGYPEDPYEGILPDDNYFVLLPPDLGRHFRVIDTGPVKTDFTRGFTAEEATYYACKWDECLTVDCE